MKIVVYDANIIIDLIELGLLQSFFKLEFEFVVTSLVFEELFEEQQSVLNHYVVNKVLKIHEMTPEQLNEIHKIERSKPTLSIQDCSAFYQAKIENGILLTSDNALRKYAKSKRINVHGHLWIFDQMYKREVITGRIAIDKLNELCHHVNRNLGLPKNECDKRIEIWNRKM